MPRPATIVLVLLLALPAIAWAFGARQPLLENRARADYPGITAASLQDPETFEQIDSAYLERLSLRGEALDLNARLKIDLLKDSPNPEVAIGQDGWLYFQPQLQACRDKTPLSDPADTAEILARSLLVSGRNALVVIPGGKLTLHPERAPEIEPEVEACVERLEREVGARLAETPGGLDLDAELLALRAQGQDVFLRGDTHWNAAGRELFARRVLDAVRPGLARETGLRQGKEVDRPADLWKLIGTDRTDRDRVVIAERTPLDPPRNVLLVGDSQMEFAFTRPPAPGVAPLIERTLPGASPCSPDAFAAGHCDELFAKAGTVIYETVGRNVRQLTETCWRAVSMATRHLRGPAASFERVDGGTPPSATGELAIAPDAPARVRVRIPGADRADAPRLIIMPVLEGDVSVYQQPEAGGPAPCATPTATAGAALVIPIPAERRARDLVFDLTTTVGARFEAPDVIDLSDGALAAAARPTPGG
ncbi:MAG: hypothetical protein JHC84_15395 [Solirubrobacteraceae bacterium]|nr:hypothetical protein [Solirubrobacteraceae bacterium]